MEFVNFLEADYASANFAHPKALALGVSVKCVKNSNFLAKIKRKSEFALANVHSNGCRNFNHIKLYI